MPGGLEPADLDSIGDILASKLLGHRRAIKVDEARVNVKPRRAAGYTYVYLEEMIGTGLTGREWDVVFTLASRADGKGLIVYSASELSGTLRLEISQLHRALRRIVDAGIFVRAGRGALRMNPRKLWHGSSATQNALLREELDERLKVKFRDEGLIE